MKKHNFLWLDLETTGLDPHRGKILEFAAVLCEDGPGDDFAVVQSYSSVVHWDDAPSDMVSDEYVLSMHTRNELFADVRASTVSLADVDEFLMQLSISLVGGRKHSIKLAGNSVHFDRAWCTAHLPNFNAYLSHRCFDITTLRSAVDAWSPTRADWPVRDVHRALPDILATIAEARVARRAMGWGA